MTGVAVPAPPPRIAHPVVGSAISKVISFEVFVKEGVLWVSLPRFPYKIFVLGKKNYHAGDINLFWEDINLNAILRVQTYLQTKN